LLLPQLYQQEAGLGEGLEVEEDLVIVAASEAGVVALAEDAVDLVATGEGLVIEAALAVAVAVATTTVDSVVDSVGVTVGIEAVVTSVAVATILQEIPSGEVVVVALVIKAEQALMMGLPAVTDHQAVRQVDMALPEEEYREAVMEVAVGIVVISNVKDLVDTTIEILNDPATNRHSLLVTKVYSVCLTCFLSSSTSQDGSVIILDWDK